MKLLTMEESIEAVTNSIGLWSKKYIKVTEAEENLLY